MDTTRARDLYNKYAAAVAYVAVEIPTRDQTMGTAFHIGDNLWVTARHVVEGNKILEVATTKKSIEDYSRTLEETGGALLGDRFSMDGDYRVIGEPLLHPDPQVDVAILRLDGPYTPRWLDLEPELWGDRSRPTPVVPLGGWLDDWMGDELVLEPVVVMGYPPIPFGGRPSVLATSAEINAVFDKRQGGHPYFILSATARGGFSGALALTEFENALGVAVESLVMDHAPPELGFFAVLSVEPIYNCLEHHGVLPKAQEIPGIHSDEDR